MPPTEDVHSALCCCTLPAGHTEERPFCSRSALEKIIALFTDIKESVVDAKLRLSVIESTISAPSAAPGPLFSEVVSNFPPIGARGCVAGVTAAASATTRTPTPIQTVSAPQPPRAPPQPPCPKLHEIDGDLFDDAPPTAALAHCCGSDFAMGAGIAVEFKKRFGDQKLLRDLRLRPGSVATRPQRDRNSGLLQRYVFHLVTKPRSANCLPRPAEFRGAVRALARECVKLKIDTVAMPQIGAGLDRQPWNWARRIILQEFAGIDIDILVFLRPSERPRRKAIPVRRNNTSPKKSPTARLTNDLEKSEKSKPSIPPPTSTQSPHPAPTNKVAEVPQAPSAPTPPSTPEGSQSLTDDGKEAEDALGSAPPDATPASLENPQPQEPAMKPTSEPKKAAGRPQKPPPEPSQMTTRHNLKNATAKPKDKGK
jgi:O-acetyl-ADP-ribose deacetylase (regulator of RNase III)